MIPLLLVCMHWCFIAVVAVSRKHDPTKGLCKIKTQKKKPYRSLPWMDSNEQPRRGKKGSQHRHLKAPPQTHHRVIQHAAPQ